MTHFNRRGSFRLTTECVESNLKEIYDIFAKINFTIFKAEFDFGTQNFIYEGTSPEFSPLFEGWEIRWYDLEEFKGEKK